jgi:hypothetical protein
VKFADFRNVWFREIAALGLRSQVPGSGQGLAAILPPAAMEHQPRRAASIAATSIFFMSIIAPNARLA